MLSRSNPRPQRLAALFLLTQPLLEQSPCFVALGKELLVRPEKFKVRDAVEVELVRRKRLPVDALDAWPIDVHLDEGAA